MRYTISGFTAGGTKLFFTGNGWSTKAQDAVVWTISNDRIDADLNFISGYKHNGGWVEHIALTAAE